MVAALTGLSIAIYVGALTPIVLIDPFAAAAAAAAAGVVSVVSSSPSLIKAPGPSDISDRWRQRYQ